MGTFSPLMEGLDTSVSLKGSSRNWEETAPGEEKENQLFSTHCNK